MRKTNTGTHFLKVLNHHIVEAGCPQNVVEVSLLVLVGYRDAARGMEEADSFIRTKRWVLLFHGNDFRAAYQAVSKCLPVVQLSNTENKTDDVGTAGDGGEAPPCYCTLTASGVSIRR